MSTIQGALVVSWLERGGWRFLRDSQPDTYQVFLLHIGATDILKQYKGTKVYWFYVQAILDFFFSATERAEMCAELMRVPEFQNDSGFRVFLDAAKAEIRCQELVSVINQSAGIRASLRSVG
ncbi:MAG: hypothetical protein AAGA73_14700 [Pseudomonadota bacterium]